MKDPPRRGPLVDRHTCHVAHNGRCRGEGPGERQVSCCRAPITGLPPAGQHQSQRFTPQRRCQVLNGGGRRLQLHSPACTLRSANVHTQSRFPPPLSFPEPPLHLTSNQGERSQRVQATSAAAHSSAQLLSRAAPGARPPVQSTLHRCAAPPPQRSAQPQLCLGRGRLLHRRLLLRRRRLGRCRRRSAGVRLAGLARLRHPLAGLVHVGVVGLEGLRGWVREGGE